MLFERGPPWDQAEAEPVVDHGVPSTHKLRGSDQRSGDMVARQGRLPCPAPFRGEGPAGALDIASLQPLHHISGNPDLPVADIRGIALISQPSPAADQRSRYVAPEAVVRQDGALPRHQLAVEPRRAIMTDLLL